MASALRLTSAITSPSSAKSRPGLDQRLGAQQLLPPAFVERAQRAFGLRESLAALRLGLGVDEIGEALDLGKIELAVLEGAARELAGLGEARSGERQYGLDDLAHHGAAAMHVELGHVLAGEAGGTRKPKHEATIEQRALERTERRARLATARLGTPPHSASSRSRVAGPEMRITAIAAGPAPLASATMVSGRALRIPLIGSAISRAMRYPRPQAGRAMQERADGNRLSGETSPYLLQHKDNPVHWRPWGEEALAEARATGKPILLSVGYAACHWCHVMAHESFEDDGDRRGDERALRQHQGRPRGAPRRRRDLYGGAA